MSNNETPQFEADDRGNVVDFYYTESGDDAGRLDREASYMDFRDLPRFEGDAALYEWLEDHEHYSEQLRTATALETIDAHRTALANELRAIVNDFAWMDGPEGWNDRMNSARATLTRATGKESSNG